MIFSSQFGENSMVRCVDKDGNDFVGKIIAIKWFRWAGYAENVAMVDYLVMPEQFLNCECDEEIWIPECHVTCLPRIVGLAA